VIIIDPSWDHEIIIETIYRNQLTLRAMFLTHSHSDHVSAVDKIWQEMPVPIYMLREEINFSNYSTQGLVECEHQQQLQAGSIFVTCLHTPGHTIGSACYLTNNFLFTGDTLFIEGCGHCYMPGGSASAMFNSVQYLKRSIPDTTLIYPGHQYIQTPGVPMRLVKKHNLYLNISEEKLFVEFCNRSSRQE
jgi:glyoxylase-like metal-dependent hydrolase (beta-lactamase superfamily II)